MGRHQARETALQTLYQVEVGKIDPSQALNSTVEEFTINAKDLDYAREIVSGVTDKRAYIDKIIGQVTIDWSVERLAKVDLNILRLALYEIYFREDVPANVAINEAVELAKTFSGDEAGKFVNGILGKVIENKEKYGEEI